MAEVTTILPAVDRIERDDEIVITFDTPFIASSIPASVFLYYTDYPFSPAFTYSLSGDRLTLTLSHVDPFHTGSTLVVTVTGGTYGILFDEEGTLEENYSHEYLVYDDRVVEEVEEGAEVTVPVTPAISVSSTSPEDYTYNYTGSTIVITFSHDPLDTVGDPVSDHIAIYIRPVLQFPNSTIVFPTEGYLTLTDDYTMVLVDNVLTITLLVDLVNVEVNVFVLAPLESSEINVDPMTTNYEFVFSGAYIPLVITPGMINDLLGSNLSNDLIARFILYAEAYAETLYPNSISWTSPPNCVLWFIIEYTKFLLAQRALGISGALGKSLSKRLGDLSISYSGPDRSKIPDLMRYLRMGCELLIGRSSIPGINVSNIPYYRADLTWSRYPSIEDIKLPDPRPIYGGSHHNYIIRITKDMDVLDDERTQIDLR